MCVLGENPRCLLRGLRCLLCETWSPIAVLVVWNACASQCYVEHVLDQCFGNMLWSVSLIHISDLWNHSLLPLLVGFNENVIADLGNYDRIIMNNPTNSLSYVDKLCPLVRAGGCLHLYCMVPKDGTLDVMDNFGSEFECMRVREVHPYSSTTSLMVFDIQRVISNVRSGNQ